MIIDTTIIGGGILAILTALKLKEQLPNHEIALFEKNLYLGDEASGRNSGVIHAGLYYPTNSLKHSLNTTIAIQPLYFKQKYKLHIIA